MNASAVLLASITRQLDTLLGASRSSESTASQFWYSNLTRLLAVVDTQLSSPCLDSGVWFDSVGTQLYFASRYILYQDRLDIWHCPIFIYTQYNLLQHVRRRLQMGSLEVRGADPAQMHRPETHPEVLTILSKMAGERPQNIMIFMNSKQKQQTGPVCRFARAANTLTCDDHLCCWLSKY